MIDQKLLENTMNLRGFDKHSTITEGSNVYLNFLTKFDPDPKAITISIKVSLNTGEFEGVYIVPGSINRLSTPKCSPVMDDYQFDRIIMKLESQAAILQKFCI